MFWLQTQSHFHVVKCLNDIRFVRFYGIICVCKGVFQRFQLGQTVIGSQEKRLCFGDGKTINDAQKSFVGPFIVFGLVKGFGIVVSCF